MIESASNRIVKLGLYLVFLVIPTAIMLIPALLQIDNALLFVNTDIYAQSIVTIAALGISFSIYFLRFRFILTFPIVIFLLFSYHESVKFFSNNEFDSYYLTIRHLHLSTLFIAGWLIGYGLSNFRYFPLLLSLIVLSVGLYNAADYNKDLTVEATATNLLLVIFYAFYTHFIRESLENIGIVRWRHPLNLSIRLGVFAALVYFLFQISIYLLQKDFKETEKALGGASQENKEKQDPQEENMLKKNEQQKFDLNQYSQLKSRFGTSQELLFAAYVDNFFPNHPEIPNPLYFTCYHLTKYDVKNERFIRDSNVPSNDLFTPTPNKIPHYFTLADSSVIKNSKGDLFHTIVESEIYLAKLSPQTFTAPSTAFSCQPINVDPDYKEQYTFAYKTKSYVSLLNSAYFIYNASVGEDKTIMKFQEERVKELKKVKNYDKVEKDFYNYYTEIPKGQIFDSIRSLGKKVTEGAKTPIEKILKVRDYFTSKDNSGKPLFKYTLYPGSPNDPNIPNASMLSHFLFKNKKGYCTYFAASTLFMLRSVGVPVRMTTGFMIVDRSDKNKGWYFIYGDQAHAWVQVYFPEYGWLDFDTTIGNEDAQESPMPDGTPPMKPQKARLATVGRVLNTDTSSKSLTLVPKVVLFGDKELNNDSQLEVKLDLKDATITKGNFNKKFKDIKIGDSIVAVSYDDNLKRIKPAQKNEKLASVLSRLPNQIQIDEVIIQEEPEKPKPTKDNNMATIGGLPWWQLLLIYTGIAISLFLLIILFTARIIYFYYNYRVKNSKTLEQKSYWIYKASEFIYCQFGFYRNHLTPLEFAQNSIKTNLNINYDEFIIVYHKIKYDKLPATENDEAIINSYNNNYYSKLKQQYSFIQRFTKYTNIVSTIKFFLT